MKLSLIIAAALLAATVPALARGGHSSGGSRSHSSSPGFHYTRTYTTRRGTTVLGHYDTNPDKHFNNNWSTKGNVNPFTGKDGTKVTPPAGEAP